jgi:hypothetical protein
MANIRNISKVGAKWKGNTSRAGDNYASGVNDPKKDWGKETAASEKNYEAGVQAGISRKAFGKGVVKAGTESWKKGAIEKGVTRFPEGVQKSGDNYEQGFAPYHAVIEALSLPPRGPKGSDANFERVKAVGKALHQKKIGS